MLHMNFEPSLSVSELEAQTRECVKDQAFYWNLIRCLALRINFKEKNTSALETLVSQLKPAAEMQEQAAEAKSDESSYQSLLNCVLANAIEASCESTAPTILKLLKEKGAELSQQELNQGLVNAAYKAHGEEAMLGYLKRGASIHYEDAEKKSALKGVLTTSNLYGLLMLLLLKPSSAALSASFLKEKDQPEQFCVDQIFNFTQLGIIACYLEQDFYCHGSLYERSLNSKLWTNYELNDYQREKIKSVLLSYDQTHMVSNQEQKHANDQDGIELQLVASGNSFARESGVASPEFKMVELLIRGQREYYTDYWHFKSDMVKLVETLQRRPTTAVDKFLLSQVFNFLVFECGFDWNGLQPVDAFIRKMKSLQAHAFIMSTHNASDMGKFVYSHIIAKKSKELTNLIALIDDHEVLKDIVHFLVGCDYNFLGTHPTEDSLANRFMNLLYRHDPFSLYLVLTMDSCYLINVMLHQHTNSAKQHLKTALTIAPYTQLDKINRDIVSKSIIDASEIKAIRKEHTKKADLFDYHYYIHRTIAASTDSSAALKREMYQTLMLAIQGFVKNDEPSFEAIITDIKNGIKQTERGYTAALYGGTQTHANILKGIIESLGDLKSPEARIKLKMLFINVMSNPSVYKLESDKSSGVSKKLTQ